MADVAGLILGTVALASLFTTCIELFERFELGRQHAYDYHLACTKVALLKARLSTWGVSLGIDKPGYEHPALRRHWTAEQEVISRSLYAIKETFENTSLLVEKYRLTPRRSRTLRSVVSYQVNQLPSGPGNSTNPKRSAIAWAGLRKRTSWAIHDKQKFDGFIEDLSFLIVNLEKVTGRTVMSALERDPALITPPQTPTPGQKAWAIALRDDSSTNGKDVPPHQPVQPSTHSTTQVNRRGEGLNIKELASAMNGSVFSGGQRTRGGCILMGNVGKLDQQRDLFTGSQTVIGGFAIMGNVSAEAATSLQSGSNSK